MNLCYNYHDEVCYEIRQCPVCRVLGELENAKARINDLEIQLANMEGRAHA